MSRRVKIKPVYPTNLFYEKLLTDWKSNTSDSKGSSIIRKALNNLKAYPLNLSDYTDLRKIKGIGEDIATRLEAACQYFVEKEGGITLDKVRTLKRGDTLSYLRNATVTKGKKHVPFLPRGIFTSSAYRLGTLDEAGPSTSSNPYNQYRSLSPIQRSNQPTNLNQSFSQPAIPTFDICENEPISPILSISQMQATKPQFIRPLIKTKKPAKIISDELLEYDSNDSRTPLELVLIVDGREDRPGSGRAKSIGEHLKKRSVIHEMRPLSVGDYLWCIKIGQGTENEIVLDYVVERKTWDDLKASIRHSRYAEQKQRLSQSGIKNVIMVIEGIDNNPDRSLEQALATTSLENGFLIHRTANIAGTARFLDDLTKYLQNRLKTERFKGHSFAWMQQEGQKTKEITVADCFLRQLTVCPMISTNKAAEIVRRFPSIRSLYNLYRNGDPDIPIDVVLSSEIPSIPLAVSTQLAQFFKSQYLTV